MQFSRHDTISLLALSVDQRSGDLDVLLLLLDSLVFGVLQRDIQIIIFLAGAFVVVLLKHESSLGIFLGHFFLS